MAQPGDCPSRLPDYSSQAAPRRFGHRGERNDDDRTVLTMGQMGRNRAGEKVLQPSAYATSPATDDDQLNVEDVGQPGERVRDIASQLPKGQLHRTVGDRRPNLCHECLVEVGVLEFGQFRIERQ
jgi:hypothetical protein